MHRIAVTILMLILLQSAIAQIPRNLNRRPSGVSAAPGNTRNAADTASKSDNLGFEHRDDAKDSITISFRYLDSIRNVQLDTSINDFYKYFPQPASEQYLGSNGAAAYSLIFSPFMKTGWDAGFHAFDVYHFTLDNSRFFKTTKPFTQLGYQLASGKEQMIKILHTQNPRPNLNFGFEYRLISAPGFFITQNTNQNNYRLFSNYQGKRKRYSASFMLLGNSTKNSENGGIVDDSLLSNKKYAQRFTIPVNLGGDAGLQPNPFKSSVSTGNIYKDFTFFFRQGYDIGKRDSVEINDSTTEYLFYPKLRFQHTLTYNTYSYQFKDVVADSALYQRWYDTTLRRRIDTLVVTDSWKLVTNDFSLVQFPDTKNAAQFLSAGARLENISGTFATGTKNFYNIVLHGEYRNKTRNRLWDILAKGEFYLAGLNNADYSAYATLSRVLNKKLGSVRLTFSNVNRSPSYIYETASSFNFNNKGDYKKENIISIKASADNPFFSLSAANYLITNYLYFTGYYQTAQYTKVINLLQASASKKIRVSRRWNLYTDITLQQADGGAPIKVPFLFTRNRLAYEGLFYKNLNLSAGLEFRYYTPYKAYNYSPLMGQFTTQDSVTIKNRPDIAAFLHFRIKSFTAYIRAENLNAADFTNGFAFTKNNFAAPHYVYPGLVIRFGILWNFVN
ncbi:MAG: putative porin [Ferruginibacter sp.]